jgi:hypothetical protein
VWPSCLYWRGQCICVYLCGQCICLESVSVWTVYLCRQLYEFVKIQSHKIGNVNSLQYNGVRMLYQLPARLTAWGTLTLVYEVQMYYTVLLHSSPTVCSRGCLAVWLVQLGLFHHSTSVLKTYK